MQVYLIGFMGVGKTSVGKRLSNRMNLPFYDSDQCIEKEQEMTIPEIFSVNGEDAFRALEKNWVSNFQTEDAIVSLGGGTACQEGMMELLNSKGITIYIKPNSGIIVSRLLQSKTVRPLIEEIKADKEALVTFVETKLAERAPFYEQAKIVVENTLSKAEQLDDLIALITSA